VRVSLDTNVLISAYTARGLSSDVYRYILAEHDLVLSVTVLGEFRRVLTDKFGVPKYHVDSFIEELRLHEIVGEVKVDASMDVIRDPDDRYVVAAAIEGDCEVLVTGDRDILDVRDQIDGIRAMTPREYWESIRAGE
jgi:putative PIN family toxin of toxin-antitoxin system